jgi:hypothetical protein
VQDFVTFLSFCGPHRRTSVHAWTQCKAAIICFSVCAEVCVVCVDTPIFLISCHHKKTARSDERFLDFLYLSSALARAISFSLRSESNKKDAGRRRRGPLRHLSSVSAASPRHALMRVNEKAQEKFLELGRPAVAAGAMLLMCSECLEDYAALPSLSKGDKKGASTSDPWHCLVCMHPEGGRHLAALAEDFVAQRKLSQQKGEGPPKRRMLGCGATAIARKKMVCCASCFSTRLHPK